MKKSVFKSELQKNKFKNHYNQILSQFPFEQKYINTTFGDTFMLTAGNESNPPVILLHGSCSNSAFWLPEIIALSQSYKVYAIDILGEAGNSEEYRPEIESLDFAKWMHEVLDTLCINKAIFVGNSLGGWMTLKFATTFPQRVSKICLLASAGLAEVRPEFIKSVEIASKTDGSVEVDTSTIGDHSIPKEVLDFMNLIVESYDPIPYLPIFSDEQLKNLNMPVLFIGGEDDMIIDALESAKRLSTLVPDAEIHLLKNTGHVLTNAIDFFLPFIIK